MAPDRSCHMLFRHSSQRREVGRPGLALAQPLKEAAIVAA
jgi:hypothetical protein